MQGDLHLAKLEPWPQPPNPMTRSLGPVGHTSKQYAVPDMVLGKSSEERQKYFPKYQLLKYDSYFSLILNIQPPNSTVSTWVLPPSISHHKSVSATGIIGTASHWVFCFTVNPSMLTSQGKTVFQNAKLIMSLTCLPLFQVWMNYLRMSPCSSGGPTEPFHLMTDLYSILLLYLVTSNFLTSWKSISVKSSLYLESPTQCDYLTPTISH